MRRYAKGPGWGPWHCRTVSHYAVSSQQRGMAVLLVYCVGVNSAASATYELLHLTLEACEALRPE